jgi:hypothetical protein
MRRRRRPSGGRQLRITRMPSSVVVVGRALWLVMSVTSSPLSVSPWPTSCAKRSVPRLTSGQ